MSHHTSQLGNLFFSCLTALLVAGCSATSQPVSYYNLTPMPAAEQQSSTQAVKPSMAIGIGPVQFPEALNHQQIAARIDQERLKYNDFHRWSGSLADDFASVLLEDLATLLPEQTTFALFPWGSYFQPTHRLLLSISRFDGSLSNEVWLVARWTITNSSGKEPLLSRKSTVKLKVTGSEYRNLVSAQSQAVADLAQEIATTFAEQ